MRETDFVDEDVHRPAPMRPDYFTEEMENRRELGQLTHQRERLEEEVATTARELEELRHQQENLQKRKQSLESLRQRQEVYVDEKRVLSQKIHQTLLLLEKEEVRAAQLCDLYSGSRGVFSGLEEQLERLNEGGWKDERFEEELMKASGALKGIRLEFRKTLARLDALDWTGEGGEPDDAGDGGESGSFFYWLKVGVAIGIPIALFGGITALLVLWILTKAVGGA